MIRALLFDFDGLILDTEAPHYEAWRLCWEAHGHELSVELYAGCVGSDFNGFDPVKHLEDAVGGRVDWEHWDKQRRDHVEGELAEAEPLPGVRAWLQVAEARGLPCAVASSSPRDWVEPLLERHGLRENFVLTRCLDDVARPKPDPELFHSAAAALGVAPEHALVIEDSQNGLRAARAAGCPCVVVPNAVTGHLDFSHAVRRLASLAEQDLHDLLDELALELAGDEALQE